MNHTILLDKLSCYGVRGLPLSWFRSYLCNRRQSVKIGSSHSSSKLTNIGVPQGSVLGPILFLLYINDLPNVSKLFKYILFADDTTLSVSGNHFSDLVNITNDELELIHQWTISNRLSLNINKTCAVIFTNRPNDVDEQHVVIGDGNVDRCCVTRFLGVDMDNSLKFNSHINEIGRKLSKSVGIIYKLKKYVPSE